MTQTITLTDQTLTLEVGKYAQQATAAVLAQLGDTVVHATLVVGKEIDSDYLPLYVEYQEKLYAGGKIKGSRWVKREGRPSDEAILTSRLIDRSIRPLFPKSLRREIQVVITTLSVDGTNDPDIPAIIAAAAACSLSGLPFRGPLGAIRVGFVPENGSGRYITNPTHQDRQYSDMDLVISGVKEGIVMVEAGANQVSEAATLEAMKYGQAEIDQVVTAITELVKKVKPTSISHTDQREKEVASLAKSFAKKYQSDLTTAMEQLAKKESGGSQLAELTTAIAETEAMEDRVLAAAAIDKALGMIMRQKILDTGKRADGRQTNEIRPIICRVRELPRTHGSAMFQRGATQALTIVTLAPPALEQLIESPEMAETKRYMHHYNMPPFSVGETGRMGWPSRREVGHGALAERALIPVIPGEAQFPYTIRVVSEIMSSNGSTSMASVCGSTLSLMDAGVPIKSPVAGIAMGLVLEADQAIVLSDIIGLEDFKGDMDFKVAGTKDGITALQMDVKVPGISFEILAAALAQAKVGRLDILDKMVAVQSVPNPQISRFAPKISMVQIEVEKIGAVIGPGGKMIRQIIAETGATVDVEDDGAVTVSGADQASIDKAVDWIKGLTQNVEVGEEYDGTVARIVPFGIFVNILPGKDGLVHISKLATGYLNHPSDVVKDGDKLRVRVAEIDDQGRINLIPTQPFPAPAGAAPNLAVNQRDSRPYRRHTPYDRQRPGGNSGGRGRKPYYDRSR